MSNLSWFQKDGHRWYIHFEDGKAVIYRGEKFIVPAGTIKKWVINGWLSRSHAVTILEAYGLTDREIATLLPMI